MNHMYNTKVTLERALKGRPWVQKRCVFRSKEEIVDALTQLDKDNVHPRLLNKTYEELLESGDIDVEVDYHGQAFIFWGVRKETHHEVKSRVLHSLQLLVSELQRCYDPTSKQIEDYNIAKKYIDELTEMKTVDTH